MTQEDKQKAVDLLRDGFDNQMGTLFMVEERLGIYVRGLIDEPQFHNAYEIIGALKFLRLLRTYKIDTDTFRDVIYKYEGTWQKCDGVWQHLEGGLKHPGTTGPMYYRLQPFQVFVLASMFLLRVWINTEAEPEPANYCQRSKCAMAASTTCVASVLSSRSLHPVRPPRLSSLPSFSSGTSCRQMRTQSVIVAPMPAIRRKSFFQEAAT